MARTLSSSNLASLSSETIVVEDLLEIYTGAGVNYFYTTGNSNITVSTPTQPAGQSFIYQNGITIIGNMVESFIPTESEIILTIDTLDNTIITNLETKLQKCRLVIYKMFRDSTTNAADTTNLITIFDGTAASMDISAGDSGQSVQVKYKNLFTNFNVIKTRTNSQLEPSLGAKMYWGSIVWS